MSKYTTEIRFICESEAGRIDSAGFNSIDEIITLAAPRIFNFSFPIFDENYRLELEKKILRYYYTREIGEETVGLWKLRLQNRLNEIMPYYNQLYNSELLMKGIEKPLNDVDYYREGVTHDGNETSRSNTRVDDTLSSGNTNSTDWQYYSDTPQGGITGVDELTYLTTLEKDTTDSDTASHTTTNTTDGGSTTSNSAGDYFEHIYGKRGSKTYASLIAELRKTFLNIDRQIINDLEILFFGLWE